MRTTLTLADDVASMLARARSRFGGSLKAVVNDALRRGLAEILEDKPVSREFRTRAVALRPRVQDVDDVAEVLAAAEGEAFS
ncbi:MAG: antitoxin [Acidobacteria bacterium]|nr:antitoxin [Acidobacteriota bacterium]